MKTLKDFTPLSTKNLFTDDRGFHACLDFTLKPSEKDRLIETLKGWEVPMNRWDQLASEAARPERLPRIERFDRVGKRVEKIILPLETRLIRREVVEQGIWRTQSNVERFAIVYLLSQIGESGVTCPLACTDGLIRVIEAIGSEFLKREYLPKLTSTDFPLSGAQFITERTGGSDVGAIEGWAKPRDDGTWSLFAEKWYCSAADEFFLVLARPEGGLDGTAGLAIYFVPRTIDINKQGSPNNLVIRRLKNKLGTQSLPTAEIDFDGSTGWLIGKADDGFKNLMTYILNLSRIHNATGSLGAARRAFAEARNYAEQRVAFGREIIHYPLIQEYLLNILCPLTSMRTLLFHMLQTIDEKGLVSQDRDDALWTRFLINLMKYRSAVRLTERIKQAILVFGANGVIEDFSILPRLLRDALILETWEGPHNTLCLQIMRDAQRFDFQGRLKREVGRLVESWPENVLPKSRFIYGEALRKGEKLTNPKNLGNEAWGQTHAKRLVDHFANLLEIGHLVFQGVEQNDNNVLTQASYLTHTSFLDPYDAFENPVLAKLSSIGIDLICEKPLDVDLQQL